MNNEPVAYGMFVDGEFWDAIHPDEHNRVEGKYDTPLYTHPVSQYKAITNAKIEPTVVSYTHPVKELTLTRDEIRDVWRKNPASMAFTPLTIEFARAILRKARE